MLTLSHGRAILRLATRGWSQHGIASKLRIDRKTVRRYLRQRAWRPRRARTSILDPFFAFLRARAPQVNYQVAALAAAIRERGFSGSYRTVARFVQRIRTRRKGTFDVSKSLLTGTAIDTPIPTR